MQAAANFGWANRHMIAHNVAWLGKKYSAHTVSFKLIYDVSHNIGKQETHSIKGKNTELLVHRKGATRSFGPGRLEIPGYYRPYGQPVLIPGTMGTASYVLAGRSSRHGRCIWLVHAMAQAEECLVCKQKNKFVAQRSVKN